MNFFTKILILTALFATISLHEVKSQKTSYQYFTLKKQQRKAGKNAKIFWKWFKNNLDSIENFETNKKIIYDISKKLNEYYYGISYFIYHKDNKYEFVISCAGNIEISPWVEALYSESPELKDWKITKYIQPKDSLSEKISFDNYEINKNEPEILVDTVNGKMVITVFLNNDRGLNGQEYAIIIAYLQEIFGEFDLMMNVTLKQIYRKENIGDLPTISLSELFDLTNKNSKNNPKKN